ncbi:sigma-54-dependent Fis family transcriptional regulator [Lamprocystis purpurea]|jgi:PAS domain S-box-containing protein|uniref:sigma-54-dependent Fis family transcriptional regulator n=1 Tax=Lamprocystis purpurea TaxID=61598 RepID=UPI000366567E|nr:sigma 54-interacting transcriptional regulator [Lamprocystis purpurea]
MQETREHGVDRVLQEIVAGTAAVIGDDFFAALVRHLARALGVRWSFVSEFTPGRDRVRTLAFCADGELLENEEYALDGTPCQEVLAGETRLYTHDVAKLFPREPDLAEMGAEGYLAMPLTNLQGEVIGHLAIIDDKPFFGEPRELSVFEVFASRVAAELERRTAQLALRRSEARVRGILNGATDAIITIDGERRVTMFNRSAEQAFGCSATWAQGQPFDRFLSKRFRHLLDKYLSGPPGARDAQARKVWAPEGISAKRADGSEFPAELTISEAQLEGECLVTVILRDLNERQAAAGQLRQLMLEMDSLKEELRQQYGKVEVVSASPKMHDLLAQVERVAATDATVLLTGETGVGKELIARTLHDRSRRRERTLVKLNCAALPAELIESELFGHEKGAFSGAAARRIGRFELADGGSLFLDEVGELTLSAQAKLLRVLQDQEFERVGGTQPIRTDARVIAATNRNLAAMVGNGTFREDLYFRLNVFPIHIPPLRERPQDIPVLAQRFLNESARKLGKPIKGIDPKSLARLQAYGWPGNVRELQNLIERSAILADHPVVEIADSLLGAARAEPARHARCSLKDAERAHILAILNETQWAIEGPGGAAALLGLAPSTLRSKMIRLGIRRAE